MACLLLYVTILTAVEFLLAEISEDNRNTNNNSTESWKVTLSSDIYILYKGETRLCSYFCIVCEHAFAGVLARSFGVLLLALPPALTLL